MGMVMVNVRVAGSFSEKLDVSFSASEGGHAMALHRAISKLSELMPGAIQLDHSLQAEGQKPPRSDFGVLPNATRV